MPAGVRCALIPTAFGLRETHERERRQDRGVARVAPNPRVPRAGAAPSSISGGTATRGSPRAREAPPIPAGERLRLAADVAPTCTIEPFATRGARAVAIEEPRARARRPRVSRQ